MPRLSLAQSAPVALVTTALLSAALVGAGAWWHAGTTLDAERQAWAETFAAQLAGLAVEPLVAGDRLRLDAIVDRIAGRPEVYGAAVYGVDQRVLAEVGQSLPRSAPATGSGVATAPVTFGDSVVGQVRVQVATDAFPGLRSGLLPVLGSAAVLAVLLALIAGIGLGRRLARWLTSSLQGIERLLDQGGDLLEPGLAERLPAAASADEQLEHLARLGAGLDDDPGAGADADAAMQRRAAQPLYLGIMLLGLSRWPAALQVRAGDTLLARVRPAIRPWGTVTSVSAGLLVRGPGRLDAQDADAVLAAVHAALAARAVLNGAAADLGVNAEDIRLGLHEDADAALLLAAMARPGTVAVHPGLWHADLADALIYEERRSPALAALGAEACVLVSGQAEVASAALAGEAEAPATAPAAEAAADAGEHPAQAPANAPEEPSVARAHWGKNPN